MNPAPVDRKYTKTHEWFKTAGNVVQFHWGSFFPDGKRIAFTGNEEGKGPRLFVQDLAGGDPKPVSPEKARYSREHVGSPYIGWLHFQPIYAQIAATQPDMFD